MRWSARPPSGTAYLSIKFGPAMVGAAAHRQLSSGLVFGVIIATSGDAPRWLLLRAAHSWPQRAVPRLCHALARNSARRPAASMAPTPIFRRQLVAAQPAAARLLRLLRVDAAGASVLYRFVNGRRLGPHAAHGAGEARSLCRGDRRQLPRRPASGCSSSHRSRWASSAGSTRAISAASHSRFSTSTRCCSALPCW